MKNVLLLSSLFILLSGCFSSKKAQEPAQTNAREAGTQNPFSAICECKNSKGLTIEAFLEKETKEKGITIDEYIETINPADMDNALFREIFLDEGFRKNMEKMKPAMTDSGSSSQSDEEQMLNEARQQYPGCMNIIMIFAPVMIGIGN